MYCLKEVELERTFLAKFLPPGLKACESIQVIDVYVPASERHPVLRIRQRGNKFEATKKVPVRGDTSVLAENTIPLTGKEFEALSKCECKRVSKTRYFYACNGRRAEVDVFGGALEGLVLVDFEFATPEEKEAFGKPEFCLVEVTHEEFLAGGFLCGKSYEDIRAGLTGLGYEKIIA
ncbi:MAG: hypothetical protein WC607_04980 [Candidatus Micrarchaeia archaeon]